MADSIDRLLYARIGNYVLVRVIGRATHYTLYQAADPGAHRMVLIKTLHVADASAPGEAAREPAHVLEARLQREAHALSALSHPNVLAIYETGEQNGYPFLVMEYLYGHPLRQHLDQGPLATEEALGILEQLADAVDAVHSQGILHRDIRPSNVMISHDGCVKLVDFGLARQPGDTTVTLMGQLVGEPAYMAPEQLRNKPASSQSDLWALGVLLYEMLAGRPPFQGANFQMVAHQVVMGQPAPLPGASAAVQAVLDKALEKDPDKRYAYARDMVRDLRQAVGEFSAPALPVERANAAAMRAAAQAMAASVLAALVSAWNHALLLSRSRYKRP